MLNSIVRRLGRDNKTQPLFLLCPTLVTDNSGTEVGRAEFDPYGNVIANTIPLALTDRLFTGQRFDPNTGLYDYRARFYDPLTGSFVQPDSIVPLFLIEMSRRGDGNRLDLWLGNKWPQSDCLVRRGLDVPTGEARSLESPISFRLSLTLPSPLP